MIPLVFTALAFCVLAFIHKSRTYAVLAASAIFNLIVDRYTSAEDENLMLVYSSIEFVTFLGVMYLGDIDKLYQGILLFMMLLCHFIMEMALSFDIVPLIESRMYVYAMTWLIIAQLLGAIHGNNKISRSGGNRRKIGDTALFNH